MIKHIFIIVLIILSQNRILAEGNGYGVNNGGNSGTTVIVDNETDFKSYAGSSSPYVILIDSTIDVGSGVNVSSNKTIIGLNEESTIIGAINIKNGTKNVIVKNLNVTNPLGDGITIREGSNVFVTHCTVYDCEDGCIDITVQSDFVTISYCRFFYENISVHKFVNLIGADDNDTLDRGKLHVTFHHNWWDRGCSSRMPRVRFGRIHMYNNYFSCRDNNYASRARIEAEILSEYNYYDSIRDPLTVEDGGIAKSIGNVYYKCYNSIYSGKDSVFTPGYKYYTTSAECARNEVMTLAGNINPEAQFKGYITRKFNIDGPVIFIKNSEISTLQYEWHNADSVTIEGLPPGLIAYKNFNSNTIEIKGIPTETGTYFLTIITNGCALEGEITDTIRIEDPTGFTQLLDIDKKCLIYPNPSNNNCMVSLIDQSILIKQVIIYDLNGKVVYTQSFFNETDVNINHNLCDGIYIIEVKGQNIWYFNKLFVY